MAAVNLDNIQFYNHTFSTPSITRKRLPSLYINPPLTVISCFNKGSSTLSPCSESESTKSNLEEVSFPPVEEVIRRGLSKECSIAEPQWKWTDSVGKSQERPFIINDEELVGAQDTSSSSNSNADSASLDGTLCTTSTPSSPKNDFEGDNNGFDYDAILDSNNIEWRGRSANAEQHEATPNCPRDSSPLSEPLQGQIGQDDSAKISCNGLGGVSTPSRHASEKVNAGQKQVQYQGVEEDVGEEEEELGKENCNMNSNSDSGDSNNVYNSDGDLNRDSDEGPRLAKRRRSLRSDSDPPSKRNCKHHLQQSHSEPNDVACAASAACESIDFGDPQLVGLGTDAGQEWEIRSIIGRQKVDGIVQYWVEWEPTWMPESELTGARELVDEFEARLQASRGNRNEQGEPEATCEAQSKRRRGRPSKKK